MASYEKAWLVKRQLLGLTRDPRVTGVGIGWTAPGDYVVTLNLVDPDGGPDTPAVVNGVEVRRQQGGPVSSLPEVR